MAPRSLLRGFQAFSIGSAVLLAGNCGHAAPENSAAKEVSLTPKVLPAADAEPEIADAEPFESPTTASEEEIVPQDTPEDPDKDWAATIELFGFGPLRTTGTTTINDTEAEVDLGLGQILRALRFAAAGRATVEKGRFGLLVDADYVSLAGEVATLVGERERLQFGARVGQIQGLYDFAFRYRFGERESAIGEPGDFNVIPYAGLRVIREKLTIDTSLRTPVFGTVLNRSQETTATRGQALVGTHANVFLTPRLRAFGRADLGGFGITGRDDLSGNSQLGLGYAVGNSTSLNLSWRYRFISISNSNGPKTGLTSYQNGLEMGVKFFF